MTNDEIVENRHNILDEIRAERERQVSKWGGPDVDVENNTPADFVLYVTHYASKWFKGGLPPHDASSFRENMKKVAALAVAGIEAYDYEKSSLEENG